MINFIKNIFDKKVVPELKPIEKEEILPPPVQPPQKIEPICPYCKKELDPIPQRKKKCPFCKNYIYVKYSPSNRIKRLVTEDVAKVIEEEWNKYHYKDEFKNKLVNYGFSENDFNLCKDNLSKQFGKEAEDKDIFWALLNKAVTETKDYDTLSRTYYNMALFLINEGKNPFKMLQQSRKMELLSYKNNKYKNVEILSNGGCDSCNKLDKKILTIEEALIGMPIPNKECKYDFGGVFFCRCSYSPVIPDNIMDDILSDIWDKP